MKESIIILAGGGPAPGVNTVIGTIGKCFLSYGYRVIGLHGGYKGLFSDDPKMSEFDFSLVDALFNKGGSFLRMSRYKPSDEDFAMRFNLELFKKNNIITGIMYIIMFIMRCWSLLPCVGFISLLFSQV